MGQTGIFILFWVNNRSLRKKTCHPLSQCRKSTHFNKRFWERVKRITLMPPLTPFNAILSKQEHSTKTNIQCFWLIIVLYLRAKKIEKSSGPILKKKEKGYFRRKFGKKLWYAKNVLIYLKNSDCRYVLLKLIMVLMRHVTKKEPKLFRKKASSVTQQHPHLGHFRLKFQVWLNS